MPAEAVLAALQALLKAIAPLNLPAALLGGLALAIWRHPRFTKDVDLLISIGDLAPKDIVRVLESAAFRARRGDGVIRLGELEILQLVYEPENALVDVHIDLLLATTDYQRQALARRIATNLAGYELPVEVLSCEDMVLHKLNAGRIIDRADAAALLRANRGILDYEYLAFWISELQLDAAFAQVWEEAVPGEASPIKG